MTTEPTTTAIAEPSELQHCIGKVESGENHRTCCCETEQRCLVAVRYATRRMYAAGLDPREVYLRLLSASGWAGVDEAEAEQGKPFPFGVPGGLADGLDMEE